MAVREHAQERAKGLAQERVRAVPALALAAVKEHAQELARAARPASETVAGVMAVAKEAAMDVQVTVTAAVKDVLTPALVAVAIAIVPAALAAVLLVNLSTVLLPVQARALFGHNGRFLWIKICSKRRSRWPSQI